MLSILFFLLVWGIVVAVLLASGTGVGWLLHWLIPDVSLGNAILTGVVTSCFAVFFIQKVLFFSIAEKQRSGELDEEDDEGEEEERNETDIKAIPKSSDRTAKHSRTRHLVARGTP